MGTSVKTGDTHREPDFEDHDPRESDAIGHSAVSIGSAPETLMSEIKANPTIVGSDGPLPPGQHPYDPVKKDLDPVAFALSRVQTFLVWIGEHRATFEKYRHSDPELAEAELINLRDATSQGRIYLQRLSELLLAGYTIDPTKRLPESLIRGWFSSVVQDLSTEKIENQRTTNGTLP